MKSKNIHWMFNVGGLSDEENENGKKGAKQMLRLLDEGYSIISAIAVPCVDKVNTNLHRVGYVQYVLKPPEDKK